MKKILASLCILSLLGLNIALPVKAEMNTQSFTIVRTNVPLKSIINSKYNGFEFTMKNHTKNKLVVKNFIVDNGVSSDIAYANVKRNGWAAAGVTFVYGWNYAFSTLGLSLVGSVIAWPFFVGASMFGNMGARQEARRFAKATIKEEGVIKSKEKVNFKVFAADGVVPTVTIVLEDADQKNYAFSHSYFGTECAYMGTNDEFNASLEEKLKKLNTKSVEVDEKGSVKEEEKQPAKENLSEKENVKNAIQDAFNNNQQKKTEQAVSTQSTKTQQSATQQDESKPVMEESPVFKQYNTGVVTDPNVKTKQQIFNDNTNFVSF